MKARGFTLIELMIVIAVLAILVAVAYPSYQRQVEKTRRSDGHSALLSAAQEMERCFTRSNTYTACFTTDSSSPSPSPEGFYNLHASTLTATTYTLSAVPTGRQADDACGTFTLDHRGVRAHGGSANDRCLWGN